MQERTMNQQTVENLRNGTGLKIVSSTLVLLLASATTGTIFMARELSGLQSTVTAMTARLDRRSDNVDARLQRLENRIYDVEQEGQ
jgi:hypothetical protein